MSTPTYGYTKTLSGTSFDAVVASLADALKSEGFGVLTEIDIKATMKAKLDVDFRRYTIFGACNPKLAHEALSHELFLGLLLPCNVIVFEGDDGSVSVSVVNPREMFKVVENDAMQGIAGQVDEKLKRVLDAIG